jgi:ATP-binding cassette, subfamily B, multidrug efflux pump
MKKLFKYLKPYWFGVMMMVVFVAVQSVGQLLLPDYTSSIIQYGIKVDGGIDLDVITKYGLLMMGVTLISGLAMVIISYFSSTVATSFGRDIRRDIFKKVSEFSLAESEKFGTSTLITRSTNDVQQVQMHTIMSFRMILAIPILLIGGIILSLQKSVTLTAVLLVGIPALIVLVVVTFILVIPLFKLMQKKIDRLTVVGREAINGVRVIRAFGQGEKEVNRFRFANEDLTNNTLKAGKIMSLLNPIVNLIFNFVTFGVVFLAFTIIQNNGGAVQDYTELANLYAVIQYVSMIMFSIIMLTITFINYPRAEVSGKRISEVLDTPITIKDEATEKYNDHPFIGNIKFDHVSFKYADAEKNVLDDISFEANVGETVAIIGSTGSGKSTVINLIPRLFDATEGSVTIDGINVRDLKLAKLRSLMGFVPQTATLFTGTIAENIAYGNQNASKEEIAEAAKIAQASDFIDAMKEQYDSTVDQGGVNYSGGQKQRLSIARAIVRKPLIYVFDDSFSALDFTTDAVLRKQLKSITRQSTVIIVAQRIGTIMDADRIIVLQDGKVVGNDTHKKLLKSCDVYREIALSQLSEEELS